MRHVNWNFGRVALMILLLAWLTSVNITVAEEDDPKPFAEVRIVLQLSENALAVKAGVASIVAKDVEGYILVRP